MSREEKLRELSQKLVEMILPAYRDYLSRSGHNPDAIVRIVTARRL